MTNIQNCRFGERLNTSFPGCDVACFDPEKGVAQWMQVDIENAYEDGRDNDMLENFEESMEKELDSYLKDYIPGE